MTKQQLILAALCLLTLTSAQATVLTIFSDSGIPKGSTVNAWCTQSYSGGTCPATLFNGQYTDSTAPEGYQSFETTYDSNNNSAGWDVIYPNSSPVNLSAFSNGELRFWLYTTTADMALEFQHQNGYQDYFDLSDVSAYLNQWVLIELPMNFTSLEPGQIGQPVNLTDIVSPFQITALSAGTFYVDDVRYVDNVGAAEFQVSFNNISDGSAASNFTWNTSLPAGWERAGQYLNLVIDPYNQQSWGVQIYTNNTSAGANPTFSTTIPSGQPGSNPAGLVSTLSPNQVLPLAWSVKVGTQPATAVVPAVAEPNNNGLNGHPTDPNAFQWLYMEDAKTPAITSQDTNAFANADPFITVKNNYGIHYVQGPEVSNDTLEFGAADPPNFIFLEANFANAFAGTYQTSTLTVEFFTP